MRVGWGVLTGGVAVVYTEQGCFAAKLSATTFDILPAFPPRPLRTERMPVASLSFIITASDVGPDYQCVRLPFSDKGGQLPSEEWK